VSHPLKGISQDNIRNPANPRNATESVVNIECPDINNKLSVVCYEEDKVLPDSEIGKIFLKPSINIDWKKYAPKELLSFDSSNPNEKVLAKLIPMSQYASRYYFPIKLDNISKNCFKYYLLDETKIYNLKLTKLIGAEVIDYQYQMSNSFFGYLIAELPKHVSIKETGLGLGIISRNKIELKVEKINPKNNPSLLNKIELHSKYLKEWVASDRLENTFRIKITGDNNNYLFFTGMEMLHNIYTGQIFIEKDNLEKIEEKTCFWGEY
jgi:hypothetical protein